MLGDFRVRPAPDAFRVRLRRIRAGLAPRLLLAKLISFFPIIDWLPKYNWRVSFFGDVSGGLTMGVFNVPQGIALAGITGVNPVYGLYTAIFPSFIYILFGTSKHNALGGFAVLSLITAKAIDKVTLLSAAAGGNSSMVAGSGEEAVANATYASLDTIAVNVSLFDLAGNESLLLDELARAAGEAVMTSSASSALLGPPSDISIATTLLFMAGIMQIIMGIMRLHFLACYFSEQVMSGFIVGGMVHVFFAQLGPALGVALPYRNGPGYLYYRVCDLVERASLIHLPTVSISACSIVFLVVCKEAVGPWLDEVFFFPVPFELILVIVGITATNFAELASRHDISVVGNIPTNFPPPSLPRLDLSFTLIGEAFSIAVTATAIHITVSKFVEKRYEYRVDYGQELYALGFVGVLSSFFPVFPITSGFQRSVVGAAVGGSTQLTCLFSSLALLSVILYIGEFALEKKENLIKTLFSGPALEYLPQCVLASIIIVSLKSSFVKVHELRQLWPTFKIDAFIWLSSMLLTICYDMVQGLALAIGLAVCTTVLRSQWPRWHFLTRSSSEGAGGEGEEEAGATAAAVAYREAPSLDHLEGDSIVVRFDGPLLFTSVDRFTMAIEKCLWKWEKVQLACFVRLDDLEQPTHGDRMLDEKIARLRSKRWRNAPRVPRRGRRCSLVIDCTRIPFVDYMGLFTLKKQIIAISGSICMFFYVFRDHEATGVRISFVVYQADLLKMFNATDFYTVVGRDRVFGCIDHAVAAAEKAIREEPPVDKMKIPLLAKPPPPSHQPLAARDSLLTTASSGADVAILRESDDDCVDDGEGDTASLSPSSPPPECFSPPSASSPSISSSSSDDLGRPSVAFALAFAHSIESADFSAIDKNK